MPYKDPEGRRRYDREYKRCLRAQRGLTSRGQTPVRKAYICRKAPHLRLPGMVFQDGWLISDNPEEQAMIEQHPSYGGRSLAGGGEPYRARLWD